MKMTVGTMQFKLVAASLLAIAGCGGDSYPFAAVSGTVTLDGKPVADARVHFQPRRKDGAINAGPSSHAITDSAGKFTLATIDNHSGAAIGEHDVVISTEVYPAHPKSDFPQAINPEQIPKHYFDGRRPLEFNVPSEGTDGANFELRSRLSEGLE